MVRANESLAKARIEHFEGIFQTVGLIRCRPLVVIYFDLDDDSERDDPDDPYSLGINLVYDASSADHASAAQQALRASATRRALGRSALEASRRYDAPAAASITPAQAALQAAL